MHPLASAVARVSLVALGTLPFLLATLPSQAGTGFQRSNTPFVDNDTPVGCVQIVGAPMFRDCRPCPPLWLGGPTIRCLPAGRMPSAAALTEGNAVPIWARVRLGASVWPARATVSSCPGLALLAGTMADYRMLDRLCGPSAGE